MKLIHTSDLHLGKVLYGQELTENQVEFFRQLKLLVSAENPDALLISGDIYETSNPPVSAQCLFTESILSLHEACPSMSIVIISGNHDSAQRVGIDSSLWKLANVYVVSSVHTDDSRHADYSKHIIELTSAQGETIGWIGAVPFAYDQNFPKVEGENCRTKSFYKGLCEAIRQRNVSHCPTVLMGHLTAGGDLDFSGHKLDTIGGVDSIQLNDLKDSFDYLALGHIHKAQFVQGTDKKVRYCGTPIAVSFDETSEHSITIVNFKDDNRAEVSTQAISVPHQLISIPSEPADFQQALNELKKYDAQLSNYIRLNVKLGTAPTDAAIQVEEAMTDKNSKFLYINNVREKSINDLEGEKSLTISEFQELTPIEVAKLYLGEKFTEEMKETLQEAIQSLNR